MNIVELFFRADWVIKMVLLMLGSMSVASWAVVVYKQLHLGRAARESSAFLEAYQGDSNASTLLKVARGLQASPLANLFVHYESIEDKVKRDRLRGAMARSAAHQSDALYACLTYLATVGSTAPFIGLFGTVWGIINAFRSIGEAGSASLAVVAPGIAEALVATAVGLAAAIPAVVAYNFYLGWAGKLASQIDDFCDELLGELPRRPA